MKPDQLFPTEREIEERLVERLRAPGFVGVCASAQNIDRVVSLYRTYKRTGADAGAGPLRAGSTSRAGNPNIPQNGWPNVAGDVPQYQRRHIKRTERFDIIDRYKPFRNYADRLGDLLPRAVMLLRSAMLQGIDKLQGAWNDARMIWSQWEIICQALRIRHSYPS